MKRILVLTDFSRNSAHAARSAAWLAEKSHAGLLLWNCSPKIPIMPGYLGGAAVAEAVAGTGEGEGLLEVAVRQLDDYISGTGGTYKPRLFTCYKEGSLERELALQLDEHPVELIVMGSAASSCSVEHVFSGSDTFKVLETGTCPVLVVPPRAGLDQLEKIVFATDFEPQDISALRHLQELFSMFDLDIEVVHVTLNGDKDDSTIAKEKQFLTQLSGFDKPINYKEIRGKDVTGRLNRISKQTGADLLSMTHHQYSVFKRLLTYSQAKKELAHQKIPLLLFPFNAKK
ncbi:universal stress protein [Mucilaginibacter sp. AK015]|uniref:universal stress protein n=1 Tax=Mucilaginibacter sp. AK015 TaxID=2723072 RepID=UPI00160A13F1|nr:universal stress protein [Mucilaginibacter sp. AK015]MBB5396842.1 nucleotide-binding universal stress UspA family protein [Mucilaginibacter sp. AK015]